MQRIRFLSRELTSGAAASPVEISYAGEDREIGIVSMNSPSTFNSLNEDMRQGLINALRKLEREEQVKVICLRSTFKVFCAGANIKEFEHQNYQRRILNDDFKELQTTISGLRKPLIGAVNKLALGGGLEIALLCDILICSDDTNLGLPEIKLGLMPGIGGTLISKQFGKSNAMKMILSGESITAQKALEFGIVSDVCKKEELHAKQIELAKKIAANSLYSLAIAKTAVKFSFENPHNAAMDFERKTFESLFNLPGAKEGIPAFIGKKKPDFRNK